MVRHKPFWDPLDLQQFIDLLFNFWLVIESKITGNGLNFINHLCAYQRLNNIPVYGFVHMISNVDKKKIKETTNSRNWFSQNLMLVCTRKFKIDQISQISPHKDILHSFCKKNSIIQLVFVFSLIFPHNRTIIRLIERQREDGFRFETRHD